MYVSDTYYEQFVKRQPKKPNISKLAEHYQQKCESHEQQVRFDCNAEVKSTYHSSQSNISSSNMLLTASIPITALSDDSTYEMEIKSVDNFKSKPLPPVDVSYFSHSHKPYSNMCREMEAVFNTINKKCVQSIFCDEVLRKTNRAKSLFVLISPLHFEIVKYRTKFILPLITTKLSELNETLRHIVGLFVKFRSKQIVSGQKKHINTLKDCIDSDLDTIEHHKAIIIPGLRRSRQLINIFHRNLKILSFWIELFRINDHEQYESMTWHQFVVRIRHYKACKNLKKFPLKVMVPILKQKCDAQHNEESITAAQFAEHFTCYDNVRKLSKAIYEYIDTKRAQLNKQLPSNASPSPGLYIMSSQSSWALPVSDDIDVDNDDIDEDEVDKDEPDEILDLPVPIWQKQAQSLPVSGGINPYITNTIQRSFSVSQGLSENHMHSIDEKTHIRPLTPLMLDAVPPKKEVLVLQKNTSHSPQNNKSASYNRKKRKTPTSLRHKPKWKKEGSGSFDETNIYNYDTNDSEGSIRENDEFPVDPLPDHVTSSPHFTFSPEPQKGPFTMIPYEEAVRDLHQNEIVYHSLFKVYSPGQRADVDVGGLLTMKRLYFVSAINYQTWEEFQQRTKIDTLINRKKKNEKINITRKIAKELIANMDIVDEKSASRLLPYFVNNTKKEMMLHIVLNTMNRERMRKLSSYFHLDQEILNDCLYSKAVPSKDTKYIKIKGIHLVPEPLRKGLLDYVLDDVAFIEVQSTCAGSDSIVITLCDYHYKDEILNELNGKKKAYFQKNGLKHGQRVFFAEYDGNRIHNHFTDLTQIQFIDLRSFDKVKAVNRYDTHDSYCFFIYSQNKEDDINVRMPVNNTRHEWIAYIDYVLHKIKNEKEEEEKKEMQQEEKHEQSAKWLTPPIVSSADMNYNPTKQKLLNDFTEQNKSDSEPKEENDIRRAYSHHFNFGIYLNYWQENFENSVTAKYATLKEELMKNKIGTFSEANYYQLFEECMLLYKIKGFEIKAQTVGPNNAKCNVPRGSSITINHLIALKIYTDYTNTQCLFKQHCRKYNEDESMQQFIRRNQEIANWCRYIRESTTFFGEKMRFKKMWTGLKDRLIFPSLTQHFYCPLSTTVERNIAENYCDDHGVILKLKASHGKARYFDVSWLSRYKFEKERLIMGARMKICDIMINGESLRSYIYALQLLEQILNGYEAIVIKPDIEEQLYKMIATEIGIEQKEYHIPEYIDLLLKKRIEEMQRKMRSQIKLQRLWLNHMGITRLKHEKLKCLFGGCLFKETNHRINVEKAPVHPSCGLFFRHFKIKFKDINPVKRFYWRIEGEEYEEFKHLKARKCIRSANIDYYVNDCEKNKIQFHLTCYRCYTQEKQKCALFLHMHQETKHIENIQVEYDLWCDWGDVHNNKYYQHVMIPQVLDKRKNYCGCQTFSSNKIKHEYMVWNIGIKIIEVKYNTNHNRNQMEEKYWSDSELSSHLTQTRSELLELLGRMTQINEEKNHAIKQQNAEMQALKKKFDQLKKQNEMLEMEKKKRGK